MIHCCAVLLHRGAGNHSAADTRQAAGQGIRPRVPFTHRFALRQGSIGVVGSYTLLISHGFTQGVMDGQGACPGLLRSGCLRQRPSRGQVCRFTGITVEAQGHLRGHVRCLLVISDGIVPA